MTYIEVIRTLRDITAGRLDEDIVEVPAAVLREALKIIIGEAEEIVLPSPEEEEENE